MAPVCVSSILYAAEVAHPNDVGFGFQPVLQVQPLRTTMGLIDGIGLLRNLVLRRPDILLVLIQGWVPGNGPCLGRFDSGKLDSGKIVVLHGLIMARKAARRYGVKPYHPY
jgi:hypothetical protein